MLLGLQRFESADLVFVFLATVWKCRPGGVVVVAFSLVVSCPHSVVVPDLCFSVSYSDVLVRVFCGLLVFVGVSMPTTWCFGGIYMVLLRYGFFPTWVF